MPESVPDQDQPCPRCGRRNRQDGFTISVEYKGESDSKVLHRSCIHCFDEIVNGYDDLAARVTRLEES